MNSVTVLRRAWLRRFGGVFLLFCVGAGAGAWAQDGMVDGVPGPGGERIMPEQAANAKVDSTQLPADAEVDSIAQALVQPSTRRLSLDTFGLLIQETHPVAHALRVEDIGVIARRTDEPTTGLQRARSFLGLRTSMRQLVGGTNASSLYLGITTHDRIVHQWTVPVLDAIRFGKYLVFIEQDQPRGEHAKRLLVSFVDLERFEPDLGKTALPVFRLPVLNALQPGEDIPNLELQGELLRVGGQRLTLGAFDLVSKVHQLAYNMTVALVDAKTYAQVQPLVEDIWEHFQSGMQKWEEDQLTQIQEMVDLQWVQRGVKLGIDRRAANALPVKDLSREKDFQSLILRADAQRERAEKLTVRMGMLFHGLTYPQDLGAPKIKNALSHVVAALRFRVKPDQRGEASRLGHLAEGFRQAKGFWIGTGAVGAALAFPEAAADFFAGALAVGDAIVGHLFGTTANAGDLLLTEAVPATAAGWSPVTFYDRYLNADALHKLSVGTAAIAVKSAFVLGIPYLVVNATKLVKDLVELAKRHPEESWIQLFVTRQENERTGMLQNLADEQAKMDGTASKFTPEQDAEVRRIISEMRAEDAVRHRPWLTEALKIARSVSGWNFVATAVRGFFSGPIDGPFKAFRHFCMSFASFLNVSSAYIHLWNAVFLFRSYVLNPGQVFYFLKHPGLFSTSIMNAKPHNADADVRMRQVANTLPTTFNGGIRTHREHWTRWGYFGVLSKRLRALRAWEKRFTVIEREIQQAALSEAMALTLKTFNLEETLGMARFGAPKTAYKDDVKRLSDEARRRFRLTFDTISHEVTRALLAEALEVDLEQEDVTDAELKAAASDGEAGMALLERLEDSSDRIAEIVKEVAQEPLLQERVTARLAETPEAEKAVAQFEAFLDQVSRLGPESNRQINRVQKATNATSSPKALARITRATIAAVVIDKPMEYLFLLTCFAAATQGIYAVIQPEMHSNTSSFWLSTYLFGTSFMVGVITDVLAGPWLRAQTFALHSEQAFNDVPEGKDAQLSFLGWWLKKVRDPDNSWWTNQKNYYSIITANLKASFVLAAFTNFLTLGRFDLDMYFLGYFACYFLPLAGMSSQYENAFELASGGYDARRFPKELRSHPELQSYSLETGQRRRTIFSFLSKVFENLTGNLSSQWIGMTSDTYGNRALGRIFFGGYTPTELAALAVRSVERAVHAVPVAGPWLSAGVRFCESLFTKNYEAWTRVLGR